MSIDLNAKTVTVVPPALRVVTGPVSSAGVVTNGPPSPLRVVVKPTGVPVLVDAPPSSIIYTATVTQN